MKFSERLFVAGLFLLLGAAPLQALETDRQQPLDVKADSTNGTLGDGMTTLKGNIEIRQGSLLVKAEVANVSKTEGRVQLIELSGNPVYLEQEIEDKGIVTAKAAEIEYEVATGIVVLTGAADVVHPQYQISGEKLIYDMNVQHFQGAGDEENGRIQIRLDPEVLQETDPENGEEQPDVPPDQGEIG
jgi:lipopolysaccharide export system protein LptA